MDDKDQRDIIEEQIAVSTDPMDIAKLLCLIGGQTGALNTGTSAAFLSNLAVLIGIIIAKERDVTELFNQYKQVTSIIRQTVVELGKNEELKTTVHTLTCDCDTCKDNVKDLGLILVMKWLMELGIEEGETKEDMDLKNWDHCQQKPN